MVGLVNASTGPRSEERGDSALVCTTPPRESRFNGAALRGARRCEHREQMILSYDASTGPRSEERGDSAVAGGELAAGRASTGPRSEERGDLIEGGKFVFQFALQRGRAPRSAEMFIPLVSPRTTRALQRGRAPRSAEMPAASSGAKGRPVASTGPRSEERGDNAVARLSKSVTSGFNGAALRGARRFAGTGHPVR